MILVGGVGELYQGDLDLGRLAAERLAAEPLGAHVRVEELHYGAVAVAQRLEELRPSTLVLVGAVARGGDAGAVTRRRIHHVDLPTERLQASIGDAVTGYVGIDLVVDVASALRALPPRTVAVEVEPASTAPSVSLSAPARAALDAAVALVRAEVRRAPLLELTDRLRPLAERLEPAPAVEALRGLLAELSRLDGDGRWGAAFAWRDRLRLSISEGALPEGMDRLDWSLWWALLEELERLEPLEAAAP